MMILLLLIHMKGIPLDMIQIEAILQTAPQLLQKPQKAQKSAFAFSGYHLEQYPRMQSYYSSKARGQNTVHKQ